MIQGTCCAAEHDTQIQDGSPNSWYMSEVVDLDIGADCDTHALQDTATRCTVYAERYGGACMRRTALRFLFAASRSLVSQASSVPVGDLVERAVMCIMPMSMLK